MARFTSLTTLVVAILCLTDVAQGRRVKLRASLSAGSNALARRELQQQTDYDYPYYQGGDYSPPTPPSPDYYGGYFPYSNPSSFDPPVEYSPPTYNPPPAMPSPVPVPRSPTPPPTTPTPTILNPTLVPVVASSPPVVPTPSSIRPPPSPPVFAPFTPGGTPSQFDSNSSSSSSNIVRPPSPPASTGSGGGLSTGAIAGIAAGAGVILLASVGAAIYFVRRNKGAGGEPKEAQGLESMLDPHDGTGLGGPTLGPGTSFPLAEATAELIDEEQPSPGPAAVAFAGRGVAADFV